MDTEKDTKDTKKIAIGKTKNQIIINPPEKLPAKNVNELFKGARGKHAVVLEKKIEMVLQAKAQSAELPEETIQQVFVRGYKTLPLNSTLTREQYAMNRVNSFISGGQAMVEDYDLLPIVERIGRVGMKGTGGAMRPHIKREKNPYNGKTTYHVVDAKGIVKHSSNDEFEAKKHLATKYNSYLGEAKKLKGKDPCWDNYKMVGLKANGDPNCVGPVKEAKEADYGGEYQNAVLRFKAKAHAQMAKKPVDIADLAARMKIADQRLKAKEQKSVKEDVEQVDEISKELANRYYWAAKSSGDQMDKKIAEKSKKLNDKFSARTHKNMSDLLAKSQKRTTGRLRALDTMAKEEVKEELLKEYEMSDKEYARVANINGPRTAKLLKHSYAMHAAGQNEKSSRAHKLAMKAKEKHLKNPENAEKHRKAMMAGAADYYASKKPGQYTGD